MKKLSNQVEVKQATLPLRPAIMTNEEREKALALFKAAEDLVNSYEIEFREEEVSAKGRDGLIVWVASFQFRWLRSKFDLCWGRDVDTEVSLLRLRPETMIFGPGDFEHLVQAILALVDGKRFQETPASHDGGVDLINHQQFTQNWIPASYSDEISTSWVASATTIVQCKLYRGIVPVTDIRDFFGTMVAMTATGLFFTTGDLTPQGKRFLLKANTSTMANRFHFIGRSELDKLLTICDRLTDMITAEEDISEAEFQAEASTQRAIARNIIYAPSTALNPTQNSLW